jgi:AAA+ superfamily predicted ATPase
MDSMPMGVFLVAATNHQHLLDTAIWRRFNISILLDLPNEEQRKQIIVNFLDDYSFNIDTEKLVLLSKGMSGAQINTLLQSLAKDCLMSNTVKVTSEDITRVLLKQFLYIN